MSEQYKDRDGTFVILFGVMVVFGAILLGSYQAHEERAAVSAPGAYDQEQRLYDPAAGANVSDERSDADDAKQSDLQAQWQMAKAAWAGIWISYFALAGLILAAHFARLAWLANERSAKADEESLKETVAESGRQRDRNTVQLAAAAEDARTQQRRFDDQMAAQALASKAAELAAQQQMTAYVVAEALEITVTYQPGDDLSMGWMFDLRNAGQTPAFDVVCSYRAEWATEEEADAWTFDDLATHGAVMGPGRSQDYRGLILEGDEGEQQRHRFSDVAIAVHAVGEETFWMKGVVTYVDINKRKWRHDFCWRIQTPIMDELLPRGFRTGQKQVMLIPHTSGNSLAIPEERSEQT